MKLHLPTAFRNALLASLASIFIPAVTLGSGAVAAELQPTLTKLHHQDPDAYPNDSSYQLIEVTENDAYAFCSYDISKDGSLVPHYYKYELKPEAYENKLDNAAELIATVGDKSYQWTEESNGALSLQSGGADIKYSTNADAEGRHLSFYGNTELGTTNGDTTLNFHWEWEEFGTAENDERNPQKSDHRWSFKEGAGEAGITYTYSTANNNSYQEIAQGKIVDKVDGVFVGHERLVEKILTEALNEALATKEIIFGGAIANNGSVTSISADFVDNSVLSRFYTEKDLYADLTVTNIAAGGAIYNATEGAIELINGNFIGNFAYVNISALSGMNMYSKSSAILMEGAMGGAIYNEGSLGDIIGNFIGNYAKIERAMLPSFYISPDAYNSSVAILAMGGAIYNSNSIDSITGSFVSNNVYNEHHTSIGYPYVGSNPEIQTTLTTYAAGGAIYNGILNHSEINSNVTASIGSISGIFVDNFVYNVSAYKFAPKEGSLIPPGGAGDCFSDTRHHAFGGAIYNGLAGIENSNEAFSAFINSIEGEFTGNYAHMKNYASRVMYLSGTGSGWLDQISLMRSYAFGGAIYNGIDYIAGSASISSVINYIGGDFSGNYAFANRITKLDEPTDKNFAFGGAIYNGAADISANTARISSAITLINADFVGNYARVYDNGREFTSIAAGGAINNSIADIIDNSGEILSSIETITGNFVNNEVIADALPEAGVEAETAIDNSAVGGAIANEIVDIESNNQTITSSIKSIVGDFIGNKAHNFFGNTGGSVKNNSIVSNYAMGGAISNSVEMVSNNSGSITSLIDSITGSFINNAVYTERGTTPDYTYDSSNGKMYAKGGALANANFAISGNSGKVLSNIGSIVGDFIENYVSSQDEAIGGAVYNGNRGITDSVGDVTAEIGSIIGDFTKNYVVAKSARGGAIYNGNEVITEKGMSAIINSIIGDFINNYAEATSSSSYADGGAICNTYGTINTISGMFINNQTKGNSNTTGGAISNGWGMFTQGGGAGAEVISWIGSITGDFINNSSTGSTYTAGGAIMNGIGYLALTSNNQSTFDNASGRLGSHIESIMGNFEGNDLHATANAYVFGGAIGNGIDKFEASVAFNNEGGSITFSIGAIGGGDFIKNHARGESQASVYGGAIANGFGNFNTSVDINNKGGEISMSITSIDSNFMGNSISLASPATSTGNAQGGAIYNGVGGFYVSSGKRFDNTQGKFEIGINEITGDFIDNCAQTVNRASTSDYYKSYARNGAFGGAIYNGMGSYANDIGYASPLRNITNDGGVFQTRIGKINGNFANNTAIVKKVASTNANLKYYEQSVAYGGAIYNGIGAIQNSGSYSISNNGGEIAATVDTIQGNFTGNSAQNEYGYAYGGAIYNGISLISGSFPAGGTIEAHIGSITGVFLGNYAEASSSFEAFGGAIYNNDTIGRLSNDSRNGEYDGSITGGIVNSSFIENYAKSASNDDGRGGAIYTDKADLIFTENEPAGEHFITGNQEIGGSTTKRAAIYANATEAAPVTLYMNMLRESKLHIDDIIYGSANYYTLRLRGYEEQVKAAAAHKGETRSGTIYLNNLVQLGNVIMDDVHLYLGHAEIDRAWLDLNGDGNTDDGKLALRSDTENAVLLEDDLIDSSNKDRAGQTGQRTYLDASIEGTPRHTNQSDIFSTTSVCVRSGIVHLTDVEGNQGEAYTEYIFKDLTAYGYGYTYADHGTESGAVQAEYGNAYAQFEFGINLSTEQGNAYTLQVGDKARHMVQSDVLTVFAQLKEDGTVNMDATAKGRITAMLAPSFTTDVWSLTRKPFDQVDYDDPNGRKDNSGNEYNLDVYAQLINFVLLDSNGNQLTTDSEAFKSFAAQFNEDSDLLQLSDLFNKVDHVNSYARSSWILCNDIELSTTKTLNDSIHIVDWRDILAEWAEYDASYNNTTYTGDYTNPEDIEDPTNFTETKGQKEGWKRFVLDGTYYLNRHINITNNPTDDDHHTTGAGMWGKNLEITSTANSNVLDLQQHNLLHLIQEGQNVYLRNFELRNVQNKVIQNLGNLTLNSMALAGNPVVNNQGTLTIAGITNIDYTITARMQELDEYGNPTSAADGMYDENGTSVSRDDRANVLSETPIANGKDMIINHKADETGVEQSITRIYGTVEYQNIYHGEKDQNTLQLTKENGVWSIAENYTDYFDTVTYLNTTAEDGETQTTAFKNFKMNELNMHGGAFNLGTMFTHRLLLRNFRIHGGGVFVNSSTLDMEKEVMGGIDVITDGEAYYAGSPQDKSTGNTDPTPDIDQPEDGIDTPHETITEDYSRMASTYDNAPDTSGVGQGLIWLQSFTLANSSEKNIVHVKFVDAGVADAVKDGMGVANGAEPSGKVFMEDGLLIFNWQVTYNDPDAPEKGYYTLRRRVDMPTPEAQTPGVTELAGSYVSMMQVYNYSFEHADLFSANINNARQHNLYADHYSAVSPGKGGKGAAAEERATCLPSTAGLKRGMWLHTYASTEDMPLRNGPKVRTNMYGGLIGGDTSLIEHRSGWASVYSLYGGYLGSTQKYSSVSIKQNGAAVGATATFYKGNFYTALTASVGTSAASATGRAGSENFDLLMGGIASRSGYNIALNNGLYVLQPTLLVSYTCFNVHDYTNASGVKMNSKPVNVLQFHPYLKLIRNTDCSWTPYITAGYVYDSYGKTRFKANGMELPSMSIKPYAEYSVGAQRSWRDRYTIYGQITGRNGGRNGAEANAGIRWTW